MRSGLVFPVVGALLFSAATATLTRAWTVEEHRILADSAMVQLRRDLGSDSLCLPDAGGSFGELCATLAGSDLERQRFHVRGRSILDQLHGLDAACIRGEWERIRNRIEAGHWTPIKDPRAVLPRKRTGNVVSAYLLQHLLALRLAGFAAHHDGPERTIWLQAARISEATAQGYLADAFAAGHILTPRRDPLALLHRRNIKQAHSFYRDQGVYVINARGDAWQTFGDGLLFWYAPTQDKVREACETSLCELVAVLLMSQGIPVPDSVLSHLTLARPEGAGDIRPGEWVTDRDAVEFYRDIRLPTLMLLPMPASATWSVRTAHRTADGFALRRHYPQLRERHLHDPNLSDHQSAFLYARGSVPEWMIPPPLADSAGPSPASLVRSDPDWASVLWDQEEYPTPSFRGILLYTGGQVAFGPGADPANGFVGIGFSPVEDLILLHDLAGNLKWYPSFYHDNRTMLTTTLSFGQNLCTLPGFRKVLFECGPAWMLGTGKREAGFTAALGLETAVLPLRVTFAGVVARLKYQLFWVDRFAHSPGIELVVR